MHRFTSRELRSVPTRSNTKQDRWKTKRHLLPKTLRQTWFNFANSISRWEHGCSCRLWIFAFFTFFSFRVGSLFSLFLLFFFFLFSTDRQFMFFRWQARDLAEQTTQFRNSCQNRAICAIEAAYSKLHVGENPLRHSMTSRGDLSDVSTPSIFSILIVCSSFSYLQINENSFFLPSHYKYKHCNVSRNRKKFR